MLLTVQELELLSDGVLGGFPKQEMRISTQLAKWVVDCGLQKKNSMMCHWRQRQIDQAGLEHKGGQEKDSGFSNQGPQADEGVQMDLSQENKEAFMIS